jgi:hypothetical protein
VAVSKKLVEYWEKDFGYSDAKHVVIPCTIDNSSFDIDISESVVANAKRKMGFDSENVVFVYSGSTAGWQSMQLLEDYLKKILLHDEMFTVCILGKETQMIKELKAFFNNRVFNAYLKPTEVNDYLVGCDYGLLIREKSITNQVASPVKFAEYLSCGLNVIISEGVGDYSEFVQEEKCGILFGENLDDINRNGKLQKRRNQELSRSHFSKMTYLPQYQKIFSK